MGVARLHDTWMQCEDRETGWETLCEHQHNTGYSVNGGFAEYVIAAAPFAARLPEGRFRAVAPILAPVSRPIKVLKRQKPAQASGFDFRVGGLGHVAIQYAKAMGLHVVALDITPEKLVSATHVGADLVVDARSPDAVATILKETGGGAHGVLVTAVSPPAFAQAVRMVRRKGTVSLVGLPPGDFAAPIFDVVLKRITVRGSIVGTRRDLDEAILFAAEGKVKADISKAPLNEINTIFASLKSGKIVGRAVLDLSAQ